MTGLQNFLKDALTIRNALVITNDDGGEYEQALFSSFPLLFWWLILLAAATAFGGFLFLAACIKKYSVTFSAATFVGSFVVSASIMAAVHYQTFDHLYHWYNRLCYPLGLVLLMLGVSLLIYNDETTTTTSTYGKERGAYTA
jgi:uncharacterized membrane protein